MVDFNMKTNDNDLKILFREATRLRDEGRFNDSEKCLLGLIELYPDKVALYVLLGHILWEMGQLKEASSKFRMATQMSPELEIASLALYHTLWSSGLKDEALEEMKRFVQISHSAEYDRILMAFRETGED